MSTDSTSRVNEAFARHQAERGVRHPVGSDEFAEGFAEMNGIDLADIAVGWVVTHGTERYESGYAKTGAVLDVFERDGVPMVDVAEERTVDGDFTVLRRQWKVNELDPHGCHPSGLMARHSAAKKLLRFAGRNVRAWDFTVDDWLVAGALNLTEPERRRRADDAATRTCEVHCVDDESLCRDAKDHLGICCECGAVVQARKAGRVVA